MLSGNIPAVSARDILPIDADRLDELWTIMQYLRERPPPPDATGDIFNCF